MKENGLEVSRGITTEDMFNAFNTGENPKSLPQLELDGNIVNYKQNTKFLGVYIT